jgi:hypothetical protein
MRFHDRISERLLHASVALWMLVHSSCAVTKVAPASQSAGFVAPAASHEKVDGAFVVLDGDLVLTREEADAIIKDRAVHAPVRATSERPFLKLDAGGALPLANRTVTYSVDRSSFPSEKQYAEAVERLVAAGKRWEDICAECGVSFVYRREIDQLPAKAPDADTYMVVRFHDAGGAYLAASFFPSYPSVRRYLNIDPSFFSETLFDRTGILRHELGHVLGYRHEHISGVAGCGVEDGKWKAITPYDSRSVMHYLCGGAGTTYLELSASDIEGHRRVYGPRAE